MRRSLFALLVVLVAAALGPVPGAERSRPAAAAPEAVTAEPAPAGVNTTAVGEGIVVENTFVSSVGWVKPGEEYPFRVLVRNVRGTDATGVTVRVTPADGARFLDESSPSAAIDADGAINWTIGTLPAGTAEAPTVVTLVVDARSESLGEDPEIVWKDISSDATLTYEDGPDGGVTSTSHGPKVIPRDSRYDTARYGDRPFPVVPVDYTDRSHEAGHTGEVLSDKINSRDVPGSTFNLYQEISYGQLFPQGFVPSATIASAGFDYAPGFDFSTIDTETPNTCTGVTFGGQPDTFGSPAYPNRIEDGWYQLPGQTQYYGADANGSALIGAVAGVGALQDIDSGCGPAAKAVYDAAQIADPKIDYSDFDTDKDGVVDFFMMVYAGEGGNGVSQGLACDPPTSTEQCPVPPYDNIWPHSSAPASTSMARGRTTASPSGSSPVCPSSTPTRPTATATWAPTTRPPRVPSTPCPSPGARRPTSTTPPSPAPPAAPPSETPPPALTSTTTPTLAGPSSAWPTAPTRCWPRTSRRGCSTRLSHLRGDVDGRRRRGPRHRAREPQR